MKSWLLSWLCYTKPDRIILPEEGITVLQLSISQDCPGFAVITNKSWNLSGLTRKSILIYMWNRRLLLCPLCRPVPFQEYFRQPVGFHLVALPSQQEASVITLRVRIKQRLFTSQLKRDNALYFCSEQWFTWYIWCLGWINLKLFSGIINFIINKQ